MIILNILFEHKIMYTNKHNVQQGSVITNQNRVQKR